MTSVALDDELRNTKKTSNLQTFTGLREPVRKRRPVNSLSFLHTSPRIYQCLFTALTPTPSRRRTSLLRATTRWSRWNRRSTRPTLVALLIDINTQSPGAVILVDIRMPRLACFLVTTCARSMHRHGWCCREDQDQHRSLSCRSSLSFHGPRRVFNECV